MLRKIVIVLLSCLVLFSNSDLAHAIEVEKQDNPISFTLEILPWEIVDKLIPRKTIFTIIDIETGMQFQVQRRAGQSHADVQPLTRKDTMIMKKIYDDKWSWKRRAIIVLSEDNMIAASMHGMPHGAGALRNSFPGHFCVHFLDSTTHKSKNANRAHKLMIVKAAGQLEKYVHQANPYELIHIFTEGINQNDPRILGLTVSVESFKKLQQRIEDIEQVNATLTEELSNQELESLLFLEVSVKLKMYRKGKGKEVKTIHFLLERESLNEHWVINGESLYDQL